MNTVGSMLREKRHAKGLTLSDIEKATKIRLRFLEAIERDDFTSLPSPSYTKGFVRNYAQYLGITAEKIMAFYRRQTSENTKSTIVPKGVANPINAPFFTLTPGKFLAMLAGGLFVLFFVYMGNQYLRLQQPPHISIDQPQEGAIVAEKKITVEGSTDADATISINGVSSIVRDDGRFYEQISLDAGANTLTIIATSRFGKSITHLLHVEFVP